MAALSGHPGRSRSRSWLFPAALYAAVVGVGILAEARLTEATHLLLEPAGETYLGYLVLAALALYILMLAVPFVPAAEIGMALMLMFGAEMSVFVYTSTVFALTIAYLVGRGMPAERCTSVLARSRFGKASRLVAELAVLDADTRVARILETAPSRLLPTLLRHRYLALALALNCPGNTLIGGGGGIAITAGMSGLFPASAYLLTVAVSVAPVPVVVASLKLFH